MPIYMDLPNILLKYEGNIITKDIMKKIIYEAIPRHHDVDEYYKT